MPADSPERDASLQWALLQVYTWMQTDIQVNGPDGSPVWADVNDYLKRNHDAQTYAELQQLKEAVMRQTQDTAVPTTLSKVPVAPSKGEHLDFWCDLGSLAVDAELYSRDAPTNPDVQTVVAYLLDRDGSNSAEVPVETFFEQAPGEVIAGHSISIDIGSSAVVAMHLVCWVAAKQGWAGRKDFHLLAPYLRKCFLVFCRCKWAKNNKTRSLQSIVRKNETSRRTRNNVYRTCKVILRNALSERLGGSKKPMRALLEDELKALRKASGAGQGGLSEVEERVVKFLGLSSEAVRRKAQNIWGDAKESNGPLPKEYLDPQLHPFLEKALATKGAKWTEMTTPAEPKLLLWMDRLARAFRRRHAAATDAEGTPPNLEHCAHKFRDEKVEMVWRTVCMFLDSLPLQDYVVKCATH